MGNDLLGRPTSMDIHLQRAIEDSYFLLAFLARAKLVVEGADDRKQLAAYFNAITTAQAKKQAKEPLSAAEQSAFWDAFVFLSNVGSPATIESIKFYFSYYDARQPVAEAPSRRAGALLTRQRLGLPYGRFTFGVLVVTLLLSLVGFVGKRTLDQFAADNQHWTALVNIARLDAYGHKLTAMFDHDGKTLLIGTVAQGWPKDEGATRVASGGTTVANVRNEHGTVQAALFSRLAAIPEAKVARLRAAHPDLLDDVGQQALDRKVWSPACDGTEPCVPARDVLLADEFVYTLAALQTERRVLEALLWPVAMPYAALHPPPTPDRKRPAAQAQPLSACGLRPLPPPPQDDSPAEVARVQALTENPVVLNGIFLTILCQHTPMPINLPPPLESMLTMDFKADLFLGVLNTYILTLLFGLLGACIHVLRDINKRLDDFTLSQAMVRRYGARLILGSVAGALIALFFNAGGELDLVSGPGAATGTLVSHLKGVTLAFVAGFSVEVLFAILDRITQLFREFAYGPDAAKMAGPPVVRQVRVL